MRGHSNDEETLGDVRPRTATAIMTGSSHVRVQAVVVAYNSAPLLPGCVAPLVALDWVHVTVVDNASPDDSADAVGHLALDVVRSPDNRGFAAGCNLGIAAGRAEYVLLLNPDARLHPDDLATLVGVLDREPDVAIAAPQILDADGSRTISIARFPRRRSTFAQALFLHRLWPHASWTDEFIRDPDVYAVVGSPEWVSGACMLLRRSALDEIGPMDEGFFLYLEDVDLCARMRAAGWDIRYEPQATVRHKGGASGSRHELLPVYARGRVRYARKHSGRAAAAVEAVGVALGHVTHAIANVCRPEARRGHLRALAGLARAPRR